MNYEKYNQDEIEKAEQANKIYQDTIRSLQTEERFVNFFKGYRHDNLEAFIKYYAGQKASWYQNADSQYKYRQYKKTKWSSAATGWLSQIAVKKIFNLQCRWAAGEVDCPGIEITEDFQYWQTNYALQLQAGLITQQEVDCYVDYRQQLTDDERENERYDFNDTRHPTSIMLSFYHHGRAMDIEPDRRKVPLWFECYDSVFGTGHLLNLPFTRVDLIEDYREIWSQHIFPATLTPEQRETLHPHLTRQQRRELRDNPEKRKAYFEAENKRWEEQEAKRIKYEHISIYDREKMKELVELIEPADVRELYHASREWKDRSNATERIQSALFDMKEAKEQIAIQSHTDYREAILEAYSLYREKMTAETLPDVFENYTQAMLQNQVFNWQTNPYGSGYISSNDEIKKHIIDARQYKGEPANFDFLKKENLPLQ